MESRVKKNIILGSLVAIAIIGLTCIAYFTNGYLNPFNSLNTERLGHFGDFIGGFLGTLLTILATLLIYLTYTSQKKELKETKKLLEQQSFENTFFNMLKVHQDLKNNIEFNTDKLIYRDCAFTGTSGKSPVKGLNIKGKTFFNIIEIDFKKIFHYPTVHDKYFIISDFLIEKHINTKYGDISYKSESTEEEEKNIAFKYDLFFEYYGNYIGDYFRNLYHLLLFISNKKKKN